jgi:hypothetical protein
MSALVQLNMNSEQLTGGNERTMRMAIGMSHPPLVLKVTWAQQRFEDSSDMKHTHASTSQPVVTPSQLGLGKLAKVS